VLSAVHAQPEEMRRQIVAEIAAAAGDLADGESPAPSGL
jgi:hypothetical protein